MRLRYEAFMARREAMGCGLVHTAKGLGRLGKALRMRRPEGCAHLFDAERARMTQAMANLMSEEAKAINDQIAELEGKEGEGEEKRMPTLTLTKGQLLVVALKKEEALALGNQIWKGKIGVIAAFCLAGMACGFLAIQGLTSSNLKSYGLLAPVALALGTYLALEQRKNPDWLLSVDEWREIAVESFRSIDKRLERIYNTLKDRAEKGG